ncbi:uncharacterized membrane protein At3g27390 isoform X2 [Cryptomeria japonica]|uniref:uncharacterized membrane protein At3g27390 isoform X2 n=1 Tax=Cryptomeria japonica TaxID=3369 RepID=UPI0027D9FC78|nr:uncharacterized membrane protein At3g27390 isoform X2 [Cryptomeria japonica]
MEVPTGFLATLWSLMAFLPFFALLLVLGILKAIIFSPVALVIIGTGNWAIIVGLWPVHLIRTYYCVANLSQIPGCILVGLLGILTDVPIITVIAVYKSPFMLFKGWKQLLRDLIGRAGPFLETACVPFAGLSIILWPLAVVFSVLGAILSSFFLGIYASAIVYQETSIWRGLAYIVATIALFDEYTNDLLYLREGSCFPRPKYRKKSASDAADNIIPGSPISKAQKQPPQRLSSFSDAWQELKAVQVWNSIFEACEELGKVLYQAGVIADEDLKDWKRSESRILNIGLPAYVLLQCFLRSVKSNKPGFVLRDGKVLTRANRPEGRAFDFFWEPMSTMLEQLKNLKLNESEELYLSKLVLTGGDSERMEKWHNGGIPPADEIKRGQLQGISKRIRGFATTLSRMPTFRRRFEDVVKAISRAAGEMKGSEELV